MDSNVHSAWVLTLLVARLAFFLFAALPLQQLGTHIMLFVSLSFFSLDAVSTKLENYYAFFSQFGGETMKVSFEREKKRKRIRRRMAVDFVHGTAFYRVNWKRMRRSQKLSQLKLLLFGSLKNDLCQYASTTECAQPCAEKAAAIDRNAEFRECEWTAPLRSLDTQPKTKEKTARKMIVTT